MDVVRDVLAPYGFSPVIAWALIFFLRNPYESLVITDEKGRAEVSRQRLGKFFGLAEGQAKNMKMTEIVADSCVPRFSRAGPRL